MYFIVESSDEVQNLTGLSFCAEFVTVYTGPETECVVDRLSPGTVYEVRVCCEGAGGVSDFSDSLIVPTEATCPGQCAPPRLHGKPRPYSVALKWSKYFSTRLRSVAVRKVRELSQK